MTVTAPTDSVGAFVGPPAVLAEGAPDGPLAGTALAVKDVIDVAGTVTGAGNPDFAAGRAPAAAHATAVARLVAAGATVVGKTITDELAFSLSGTNVHYGTPRNVAAPDREPGGSSSGSAAAVAAGLVDLGLGTDTGGSIRVPASYCGLVGWRPTHGSVPTDGVVHLARSFDTVGLLARDVDLLSRAAAVLLGPEGDDPDATPPLRAAWFPPLLHDVDPSVASAVVAAGGPDLPRAEFTPELDLEWVSWVFRTLQGAETWAEHGAWLEQAQPRLGRGVAARFQIASEMTPADVEEAEAGRDVIRRVVQEATAGGRILLAPAATGPAPRLDQHPAVRGVGRAHTIRLTSLAGLAGAPVVVLPGARAEGHPIGVAAMSAPGTDLALLAWARRR